MNNELPPDIHDRKTDHLTDLKSLNISLELPSLRFAESFFQAMVEFEEDDNPQIPHNMTEDEFPAYLQRLHDQSVGKNLKEGYVPSMEFWIADADGFAGRIILGLKFVPSPVRCGHHVGYAIRPSKRRKGYATRALRLLLDEALKLHIFELMPTCDVDNLASRKVIERNGGVLLNSSPNEERTDRELRYLIDLTLSEPAHGR